MLVILNKNKNFLLSAIHSNHAVLYHPLNLTQLVVQDSGCILVYPPKVNLIQPLLRLYRLTNRAILFIGKCLWWPDSKTCNLLIEMYNRFGRPIGSLNFLSLSIYKYIYVYFGQKPNWIHPCKICVKNYLNRNSKQLA